MELLSYILTPNPGSSFQYYVPAIVFILLIVIAAIVFRQIYNSKRKTDAAFRKLFKNTQRDLWLFAGLFSLLIIIRYENIPYFSMRLWLIIAGLWFAYVIHRGIKRYKFDYKAQIEKEANKNVISKEKSQMKKYTPNKKKRK